MGNSISEVGTRLYAGTCDLHYLDVHNLDAFRSLGRNSIISSFFSSFEADLYPEFLGLKYVAEGSETYWLNGKRYQVSNGKYLLVNEAAKKVNLTIRNADTRSLCVNIEPGLLNDILLQLLQPDNLEDHRQVSRHLLSPELFIRESVAGESFRKILNKLAIEVPDGTLTPDPIEHIYDLTTFLIQENLPVIRSYYKLKTAKLSTRQELFHRLMRGKEMLDDSVFTEVSIGQVADWCWLSEFRFYRLFRQCFGMSPYNYLFRRRIEKGLELKKQNLSWGEIAFRLNFTDLAAFSKGFKKITGVSPSLYKG